MSTKTEGKLYQTKINASVITTAIVRSNDNSDKVKEYTVNAFVEAMMARGIAISNIEVEAEELSPERIAQLVKDGVM